ncbi:MAG: beta-lactamase family protein [Treponema sp.]|jgi:CubicO group peptidase (beta-lactamase class C family)|nr:beta-lactamase family protein [Treponema sp.]
MKHHTLKNWFCICLLFIIIGFAYADNSTQNIEYESYNNFLENAAKDYRVPGLALAVFDDEKITYTFTHDISESGNPIEIDTPFFLGSTTKTFTALCIMILNEKGLLNIEDPVKKYLDGFYFKDDSISPGATNNITLEQLLNHTSGISQRGIPGTGIGERSLQEELLLLNKSKLMYAPGSTYEYCNVNYRLLGLIIETVTGKRYGSVLDEEIFQPLSMQHSYSHPSDAAGLAEGHGQIFGFLILRNQKFYPGALPSGYLISSASDIAALLIEELRASQGRSKVFSSELIESTWNVPQNIESNYAKGWMKADKGDGTSFLIHGGSVENYQSFFCIDPSAKKGFVLLMNQGGLFPMINTFNTIRDELILKLIYQEEHPYTSKKNINFLNTIIPVLVLIFQAVLFLVLFFRRHLFWNRKIFSKISIGLNIFWCVFFLFMFTPLMNAVMGDTASLSLIGTMIPELFVTILIIVISNALRAGIKTLLLLSRRITQ